MEKDVDPAQPQLTEDSCSECAKCGARSGRVSESGSAFLCDNCGHLSTVEGSSRPVSVRKAQVGDPFSGYGRPFSGDGLNMSEYYYHDNPATNVGPYSGPSSYSINTVEPYNPPHAGEENPAQNVGPYNPPSLWDYESEPDEDKAPSQSSRQTVSASAVYKDWNNQKWFDGSVASINRRIAEAEELRRRASSTGDARLAAELAAQIEVLRKVADEYDDSHLREFVSSLPGGTVALEYDNLIDGGLVDVTSFLDVGAHRIAKEVAEYDWDRFKSEGAKLWVEERRDRNPGLLSSPALFRLAAVEYVKDKTMVLLDPVRRAEIIDEFVTAAERHRRRLAKELESSESERILSEAREESMEARIAAAYLPPLEDNLLPGSYTTLDSDYDERGYLNIGEDDGSILYRQAADVLNSVKHRRWEEFTTEGAREWFFAKVSDSPVIVKHADVMYRAASEFASEQCAMVPDSALRKEIVRAFTDSVEYLRRQQLARNIREASGTNDDVPYAGEDEVLWI